MYSLQWLKIELKIFSNRKIQILLREPDGDTYFRVWIQLLIIAVECNRNGKLVIGNNKPMTIENFSNTNDFIKNHSEFMKKVRNRRFFKNLRWNFYR